MLLISLKPNKLKGGENMNADDLKRILAGFSIAGLLSVAAISSPGQAASG